MSVINRVLQDLEERRGGVPPSASVRAVGPAARRGASPAVQAGVAAVVIAAGGGVAAWMAGWFDRATPPAPVVASAPVRAPVAPLEPQVPAASASASGAEPAWSPAVPPAPPTVPAPVASRPGAPSEVAMPEPEAVAVAPKPEAVAVAPKAETVAVARKPEAAAVPPGREAAAVASKPEPAAAAPSLEAVPAPATPTPERRAEKRTAPRERVAPAPVVVADSAAEVSAPPAIEKRERPLSAAERGEALYRQGVAHVQSGRSAEAEALFRQALAEDPRHPGARQALLGMMLDGRRTAEAEGLMREGIAADPTQSSWAMVLARLQAERSDTAGGIETLRAALAQGARQGGEFHALLAALLQRAGDHKGAVQSYQDALATSVVRPVWHMGQGISLRELGRKDEARAAFQRALDGGLPGDLRTFVERQLAALGR